MAIYLLIGAFSADTYFGGVRSRTTGIYLNESENIAIGTSTPVLADIHILRTATSTLALDGVLGCLAITDKTTGNPVYYISDGQDWATTTAGVCGF